MKSSKLISVFLITICVISICSAGQKPNIVFILADDMGYGDAGCYNDNSKVPTPNIDSLAADGMRFTDAHAAASWCVPSRYGLLTGIHPTRHDRDWTIKDGQLTVARLLQGQGYHTGMVGKWHLDFVGGHKNRDFSKPMRGGPVDSGFDYYFGIPVSLDIPPYYYIENDRCVEAPSDTIGNNNTPGVSPIQGAFWRGGGIAPGFKHDEVLPKFTEKAVSFLRDHKRQNADQPFFLYLALAGPHTPWMPTGKFVGSSKAGMYGDFAAQIDATVGQVLKAIDRMGEKENTIVIFSSDNGPVWYSTDVEKYDHACVGPLRGMKADAWEGGHRVPFVVRWPAKIERRQVSNRIISFTDFIATVADVTGEKISKDLDSISFLPLLLGEENETRRTSTIHNANRGVIAIRSANWKYIEGKGSGGFSDGFGKEELEAGLKKIENDPPGQLYNLKDDIGESKNLFNDEPKRVKRLKKRLDDFKASLK